MKRVIILMVFLGLSFAPMATALEPGDTLWTRTYGGISLEWSRCVSATSDGGYIIAGMTWSFGAGREDVYLVKTDSDGDTLWTRTYGGSDHDRGNSVQQTSDGGYIIAGMTWSFGAGREDVYLVKTDSSGDTLWTRTYGGWRSEAGNSVQQTSDGGYIIAGYAERLGASADVVLLKTDSSGNTLWTRTYGGSSDEKGYSAQLTSDGGYIIAGYTWSFGAGRSDVYLLKTDSSGDTLWTRTCGGSDSDWSYSVQQTSDGGYIIAGETESFGAGDDDVYLVKTDSDGDTLWTRTYGGSGYDRGRSVQQTSDGGYIIAGYTNSFGAGNTDVWLLKTDSSGDTLWTRIYGGRPYDYGRSVEQTSDGGYIIAGDTRSFGTGDYDVWLLRIVGEAEIAMSCRSLTPILCRGKNLYFTLTVWNNTGGSVSGTLTFGGYAGYDCDPLCQLVAIPRTRSYPPGTTTEYYFFKVPRAAQPGQYSTSVGGSLSGQEVFCCMNVDIIQCGPWKTGGNSEWQLVEVDASEFESSLRASASLSQCYPNPFNANTVISYELATVANVKLEVYNILGNKVATVLDAQQQAGYRSVTWDASEVSSGLYFYKLTAGDYTETRRMILVK